MRAPAARMPLSYCGQEVRRRDPDRYLATLFAPAAVREALFALYAFDHEIAKVRDLVSEPMAGLIRLQWWREALDGIAAARPPAHPIAEGLGIAFTRQGLQRARLEAAIDGRARELAGEPLASWQELEPHLESTGSSIVLAALDLLGIAEPDGLEAARRVGVAQGLLAWICALPHEIGRARPFLPLAGHASGASAEEPMFSLARSLATRARAQLDAARERRSALPAAALPALLPAVLVERRLALLRRARFDPRATNGDRPLPLAPLELLLGRLRRRF